MASDARDGTVLPVEWTFFSASEDDLTGTYLRPIFGAAQPYAVVRPALRGYEVAAAASIDHAMVICDEALRGSLAADPGLRVYLRANGWIAQVHYVGTDGWPTHEECVDRVAWSLVEMVMTRSGTPEAPF